MPIGAIIWDLHVPAARSLKEKRSVLQSIKARLHNEFNASVAETAHQDSWQRCELTACVASADRRHAESVLSSLDRFIASAPGLRIIDTVRVIY
jgi:uncharacterized protein YlxP (DUF503 family)